MSDASTVKRLKIEAFEKPTCSGKVLSEFIVQVNPQSVKYNFGIKSLGEGAESSTETTLRSGTATSGPTSGFGGYNEMKMNFSFIADATGILPISDDIKADFVNKAKQPSIRPYLKKLQDTVYGYVKDAHRPAYLRLTWGNVFPASTTDKEGNAVAPVFKGQLETCAIDIVLFSTEGEPIKAKIDLNIKSVMAPDERPLGKSPDLTHYVDINYGDKMTKHCNDIYGRYDAFVCSAVANYNNMIDSSLQPMVGKQLVFPSIHLLNELYIEDWEKSSKERKKKEKEKVLTHYEFMVDLIGESKAKQYFKTFDYDPNQPFDEWNKEQEAIKGYA